MPAASLLVACVLAAVPASTAPTASARFQRLLRYVSGQLLYDLMMPSAPLARGLTVCVQWLRLLCGLDTR